MNSLHDWELHSVKLDWKSGETRFDISWVDEHHVLVAKGTQSLHLSREFSWGPTNWIMGANEPIKTAEGQFLLKIEMQSGDNIEIVAESFEIPDAKPRASWQLPLGK
ncbi:MAG TPA: hypothetical protein VHU87_03560 [Rhizomicrobium sp.]|nr:hypothetical protein [Rhizomicrobium sp.]